MPEFNKDILDEPEGDTIHQNEPPWMGGCWGWVQKMEAYGPTPSRVLWQPQSGCAEVFRTYTAEWTYVPI